jgi:hypothetical protein
MKLKKNFYTKVIKTTKISICITSLENVAKYKTLRNDTNKSERHVQKKKKINS